MIISKLEHHDIMKKSSKPVETASEEEYVYFLLLKVMICRYKNGCYMCALCPCLLASSILLSIIIISRNESILQCEFYCGMSGLYNSDSNIEKVIIHK